MSLESKCAVLFRGIDESTPFISNRMDMTVSEHGSIPDSASAVTKMSEVGSSHPRLKKSWIILGCLIGFLMVVSAWHLFAEIKARNEAFRIKEAKERDARVKNLYDEFIGPLDDSVKIVREGAEVFEAKKTPVGVSITASNTQNSFLLQNEVTYQPDPDGRRMYFTFSNGRIEFEYDRFSWYYGGRLAQSHANSTAFNVKVEGNTHPWIPVVISHAFKMPPLMEKIDRELKAEDERFLRDLYIFVMVKLALTRECLS